MYYNVPVQIGKQEDGLWRVEAPDLQGCFVDAPTLEQALAEIHEVIAMMLDIYAEDGRPLPPKVTASDKLPLTTTVPVVLSEHKFRRFPAGAGKASAESGKRQIRL
ncbi:MAG TPA: type II toxin-antitoxin system HicB family antitoxin [Dehalococcoidia bacterium]|nr:type II toxin-antitoxin system HicB family antitoxin [Dehalococcoidia bacterium]